MSPDKLMGGMRRTGGGWQGSKFNDVNFAILHLEHTSASVVGVDMSSDNIGGPLAVRVFSVCGGAKLPARALRAESDLDVL